MLDIEFIRKNPEKVKQGCKKKGVEMDIDRLLKLDKKRRKCIEKLDHQREEKNKLSRPDLTSPELKKAKKIKQRIKGLKQDLEEISEEFEELMLKIPNLPLEKVPPGEDEKDNVEIKKVGPLPDFKFKPKSYLEIARKLDLIDIKRAAKISGTRFGFLKKEAVLLQWGLIDFSFDFLTKQGFVPIIPPIMLRPEMMKGTGHLSLKDRQEKYLTQRDNLYLAGSAEQPIVSMHAQEILKEKDLPLRYVGFSPCFRREAGSYGKDTKGIFRVHQFDKVEMVSFCTPLKSEPEHQYLISLQEKLMQGLDIPYRIVQMCTGDLGFPAASAYDLEAWLPSEKRYRETHSAFNDTDFQTRRLNTRYRPSQDQELEFPHALNATAFAMGRTLIAIIENYQQKDGSIKVPRVLQKYVGFKKIPSK